jgi:hypothetical protein
MKDIWIAIRKGSYPTLVLLSWVLAGCMTSSAVRDIPVRKPVQTLVIDCIEPKYSMNVLNNSAATSHRDGYDEEVLHQYQVCHEV